MSSDNSSLVSKVWNYAHVLRDQGVSYGDYVEQITYLLFLKMDGERADHLGEPSIIPEEWRWDRLISLDGDELELHYSKTLRALGSKEGIIGTIFRKAQNKLTDPAKLKRVVSLINEETWIGIQVDVKGTIYEGLLERNATEVKSGAGQYFTPRPVIQAMVEVMRPKIGQTICDPACGTGGFLLAAYEFMKRQSQDKDLQRKLREETFTGVDIVDEVVRLCAMNLYLHGIGNGQSPVTQGDALAVKPNISFDMVLTNPPFGKKSSFKVVGEDGGISTEKENYERDDFKFTTSNKQLNFLQHIMSILSMDGKAAVVLPDNVLFEAGNAGEGLRKRLLDSFDFHTLLRLPTGIFYKQGVKANVLFFDKKPASKATWTKRLWIYDLRTNKHFTLVQNQLSRKDLDEFIASYCPENRNTRVESERFKCFTYEELVSRDKVNLDIFWLKDEGLEDLDNLPAPSVIAAEIVDNLEAALEQFRSVAEELSNKIQHSYEQIAIPKQQFAAPLETKDLPYRNYFDSDRAAWANVLIPHFVKLKPELVLDDYVDMALLATTPQNLIGLTPKIEHTFIYQLMKQAGIPQNISIDHKIKKNIVIDQLQNNGLYIDGKSNHCSLSDDFPLETIPGIEDITEYALKALRTVQNYLHENTSKQEAVVTWFKQARTAA